MNKDIEILRELKKELLQSVELLKLLEEDKQMKQNNFYEVDGCTDFIPVKLIEEHKHMTNPLKVELTETGYRTFVPHMYSFPK